MIDRRYSTALCVLLMLTGCSNGGKDTAQVAESAAPVQMPVSAAQVETTQAVTTQAATPPTASSADPPTQAAMTPVADSADRAPAAAAGEVAQMPAKASPLRASFAQCVEASGGVDAAMQDCIADEYAYHDGRLNAAYATLKRTLPAAKMIALRDAQRAWLRERDASCVWDARTEGSAQRLQANYCMMESAAKRADALEVMLRSETR